MFILRLLSSIVLLSLFFCGFLLKNPLGLLVFSIMGLVLVGFCIKEYAEILKKLGIHNLPIITEMFGILLFLGVITDTIFRKQMKISMTIIAIFGIYCWVKILFSADKKQVIFSTIGSAAALFLVIFPLNFLTMIYISGYGETFKGMELSLFLILVTKSGDIGAYCIGTLTARGRQNHKIVPLISPKKSWEGTVGGCIFSVMVAYVIAYMYDFYFGYPNFIFIGVIGLLLFIGGFIGDLSESVLKRTAGIKDSGVTIPGIGGALDLTDSLLINAPLFFLLLKIIKLM